MTTKSTVDVGCRIDDLDLGPIKFKLMHPEEGEGWSRELVEHVEVQYRQFLKLIAWGKKLIVPTKLIDRFWHAHILDTAKYRQESQWVFGFYLDHFPYFGLRGEEDRRNLERAFNKTLEVVRETFNSHYWDDVPVCLNAARAGSCHGECASCASAGCSAGCGTTCAPDDDDIRSGVRPQLAAA